MDSGFYGPAFRMIRGQVARLESITENLANSNTLGYRRLVINTKPFDTVLGNAMQRHRMTLQDGTKYDPPVVDFTPGPFQTTDRPLDCAIEGDGFFVLQKDGREYYTRAGRFHFDPDGLLVNEGNFVVKGQNGDLRAPAGTLVTQAEINSEGTLRVGETAMGRLELVRFADPSLLERTGTTLFTAPRGVNPEPLTTGSTRSGMVEGSNTSVMEEMAALIQCVRAYEACQRMLKTHDETQQRLVQQA